MTGRTGEVGHKIVLDLRRREMLEIEMSPSTEWRRPPGL